MGWKSGLTYFVPFGFFKIIQFVSIYFIYSMQDVLFNNGSSQKGPQKGRAGRNQLPKYFLMLIADDIIAFQNMRFERRYGFKCGYLIT